MAVVNTAMEEHKENLASKTGPKPKKLVKTEYEGLAVGRDKKVVAPQEVFKLAAMGCKDTEICDWFGIDGNTLRYNFSVELIKGRESLKHSLRRAMLHNACVNNNAAVQIFLAKNLLGYSDSPIDSEANAPLPWSDD
jgi:hypothetical protein